MAAEDRMAAEPPGGVGRHVGVAAVGEQHPGGLDERRPQGRRGEQLQRLRPAGRVDELKVADGQHLRRHRRHATAGQPRTYVGRPLLRAVQVQVGGIKGDVLRDQQAE